MPHLRLRPAACELVDAARFGLIVDIDNPAPVPIGVAIPREVVPRTFPEFYGETWGFEEAVAEPPAPNLAAIEGTQCGPGRETHVRLAPSERLARGWILERAPEPDMTLEIVATITEFSPDKPWDRRRELACLRLRAELRGTSCSVVELSDSACHTPGAIYLDVDESVPVSS